MAKQENNIKSTYKPKTNVYRYKISMIYSHDNETEDINAKNIKTLAIDYNYDKSNMPILFTTMSISKKLVDKIVKHQDEAVIILKLERCTANSNMPDFYTTLVEGDFIYFISDDINKGDEVDYPEQNKDREDVFRMISIGLMPLDCINKNKKVMNGVLSGKLSSTMYYLLSELKLVMETPSHNKDISIYLPPMNSLSKALEYLNSLYVFYDTPYRFFIDFDVAYLLSSSGRAVKRKGDQFTSILIEGEKTTDDPSKLVGVQIDEKNAVYRIPCDSHDFEVVDNHFSEKIFSKVSATGTSGTKTEVKSSNPSKKSPIKEKTRVIRVRNENTGLINNMMTAMDNSAVQILVKKTDLDTAAITINKEYTIKADTVYGSDKYNGRYILIRKRELYMREDDDFILNTMMIFKRIASK